MQKRALPSTSSGQPSQPKKPCFVAINQERSGSERNLVPSSYLTVEDVQRDVQRVVRKEVECAISQWAENFQSFIGDALKDIAQRVCSTENAVQKLVRKEVECAISQWAENFQSSIGDALKDIAKRGRSTENAVQKLTEAVELANIHSPHLARAIAKSTAKNDARNLQLQLQTKLSIPLFTGKKLEGEGGARIKVALIDADTGSVVASGPEASIKLDVIVLEGDFNKDDEENWTQEEFENYVVKEREGKRPLLTGKLQVMLKEGVGELGDLTFTDNSSWNRSKSFRIGLKVASSYGGNTRIREAKTDAFPVKEHRAYKKHYPPASDDEVWRLKNIAKDGSFHKRLNEAGIHKVEEFLQQLSMDSEKLRNILGMTEKNWKPLLVHAQTCTPNGKLYVYNHDNESDRGVIFNNFGQLSGLTADGVYCAADSFSLQQKVYADRLVKKAYENWNDVRQFDAEASSSSMLEKISCSPCEVLRDQQCFHPVHNNMHLPILASHVGLKVPPRTSASTVEGNSGIPAAPLAIQSQSLNSQDATWKSIIDSLNLMEPSADTNVQPSGSFPGNSGITAAGLPMQLQSLNFQNTTWNQIIDNSNQKEPSADMNVQPFGQPCGPLSSILASNIEDDDIDLFSRD